MLQPKANKDLSQVREFCTSLTLQFARAATVYEGRRGMPENNNFAQFGEKMSEGHSSRFRPKNIGVLRGAPQYAKPSAHSIHALK